MAGPRRSHRGGRGRRGGTGQATVELALLLPFAAVLVLVLVQAALVARDQVLVVHAARDAAREVSVGADLRDVRATVTRALPGATVSVERSAGRIVVDVAYTAPTAVPLVGPLLPDPTLRARVEMAREVDP